ncbi:hypothetical protein [Cellulomonas xylanilytica]|uniref:Uncharacterized protein n=1 Tax=Cellulomonas xylanilytica TaxID=233583 RepID=A0A510VD25_9CELL|nr:hypothetical protein [Cellulomonas xylanilytica]GEK23130.1 hypothetical protein CXY01_36500 [Cellulomonas xylanilytica]
MAVAAALAAGCGSGPGTPTATSTPTATVTASPTPTLDPALAEQQESVEAATATLATFLRVSDEIAEAGYADWSAMSTLVGGELRTNLVSFFEQSRDLGARQTSRGTVESIVLKEFQPGTPGAGGERVLLDACLDNSTSEVLLPDGSSDIDRSYPQRVVVTYTVQHHVDFWTVDDAQSDASRTC